MTDQTRLRIIFAGTPDFAAHHLQALLRDTEHTVIGVYTQPDRPAGRGKKLQASPVKLLAQEHGLAVYQPQSLKGPEDQQALTNLKADLMIVVAYGLLLPKAVLEIPRLGCINVHASILPRWRGAAPIQRAIEAGDSETGITIMQMDEGLDTGDMLNIVRCPIQETDTATDLHDRLASIGPDALHSTLQQLATQQCVPVKQPDDGTTYAKKLVKNEACIDWQNHASIIDRQIRAFNPYPVAFTLLEDQRLRVWRATISAETHSSSPGTILRRSTEGLLVAAGDSSTLLLQVIQPSGKKAMAVKDVLNGAGHLFQEGIAFTSPSE